MKMSDNKKYGSEEFTIYLYKAYLQWHYVVTNDE